MTERTIDPGDLEEVSEDSSYYENPILADAIIILAERIKPLFTQAGRGHEYHEMMQDLGLEAKGVEHTRPKETTTTFTFSRTPEDIKKILEQHRRSRASKEYVWTGTNPPG